jgi:hypothetical protein
LGQTEFSASRADVGAAGTAGAEQFTEPKFDETYGMWYRYDRSAEAYQWTEGAPNATPAPSAVWMTQAEAEMRLSATAPGAGDGAAEAAAGGSAAERQRRDAARMLRSQAVDLAVAQVLSKLDPAVVDRGGERLVQEIRRRVVDGTAHAIASAVAA